MDMKAADEEQKKPAMSSFTTSPLDRSNFSSSSLDPSGVAKSLDSSFTSPRGYSSSPPKGRNLSDSSSSSASPASVPSSTGPSPLHPMPRLSSGNFPTGAPGGMDHKAKASTKANTKRYGFLTQQVSQLNTDLHRTAALSQSLRDENDQLRRKFQQLKQDHEALNENYVKVQQAQTAAIQNGIEADKRHEALVQKWKRQVEQKAKEFEQLQRQLAVPKDLDQLRIKIQGELETPHRNRVAALEKERKKYRDLFFNAKRESEVLQTSIEQLSIDQGNELQCLRERNDLQVNELKRLLQIAEQKAEDASNLDRIHELEEINRSLEQSLVLAKQELTTMYDTKKADGEARDVQVHDLNTTISSLQHKLATAQANNTSHENNVKKLEDESCREKARREDLQVEVATTREEIQRLKQQLQQKESLMVENNNTLTTKLLEARSEWERERSTLKEQLAVAKERVGVYEASQSSWEVAARAKEKEVTEAMQRQVLEMESKVCRSEEAKAEMEIKIQELKHRLKEGAEYQEELDRELDKEKENLGNEILRITKERDSLSTKYNQGQDLVSKMKLEFISLRSKNKELESEYKVLQSKHREALELERQVQVEKEQLEVKLKLQEELTSDLEAKHSAEIRAAAVEMPVREVGQQQPQQDTEVLAKWKKKCANYKQKLLDLHEVNKKLKKITSKQALDINTMRNTHQIEIRNLVDRMNEQQVKHDLESSLRDSVGLPTTFDEVIRQEQHHSHELDQMMKNLDELEVGAPANP